MTSDEGVRPNSSVEKLATLKTIFKEDGTVTGGLKHYHQLLSHLL
jgi:acetyl-CoA C-acetyltransferase